MRANSSSSVKVIYLDRDGTLAKVRRAATRLGKTRPEINKIVVFGSLARGEAVPGSDVDLLLVLTESNESFLDRIPLYYPAGVPIGVDVFAYTEEEIARMLSEGNSFVARALSEGLTVFQRH